MAGNATFDPSEADWIDANRLWLSHARWRRWMRRFIAIIVALIAINVAMTMTIGVGSMKEALLDSSVMILAAAVIAGTYWLTPVLIPRNVRTMFRQRRTMGATIWCSWDDDALVVSTADGSTKVRWDDLHRWLSGREVFAFLLTDNMMLMISHRALSAEQVRDLEETAERLGSPKR